MRKSPIAQPRTRILTGDIGGTGFRLGLYRVSIDDEGHPSFSVEATSQSQTRATEDPVQAIASWARMQDLSSIGAVCIGAAGIVHNNEEVRGQNLPWVIKRSHIAHALGLKNEEDVEVRNDFETYAMGTNDIPDYHLINLSQAAPTAGFIGNRAAIGAGTGLGEAGLYRDNDGVYKPFATEGANTNFGPIDEEQDALLSYLRKCLKRQFISWQDVVSGFGLGNIFNFLKDTRRVKTEKWLLEMAEGKSPHEIAKLVTRFAKANNGRSKEPSPICQRALHIFVDCFGCEAGNLALKTNSWGGVFIGGGIAKKVIHQLSPGFMEAFLRKGDARATLERVPVYVDISDDLHTALRGGCWFAYQGREDRFRPR